MIIIKDPGVFYHYLPVIALPEYLTTLNAVSDFGYFVESDLVLPFVVRRRLIFKWIEFVTTVLNCKTKEEELEFMNKVIKSLQTEKVDFLISRNTALFKNYLPGSLHCKFGSYRVDLTKTEDELFLDLHSKHRNVIRKAEKDGIVISNSEDNFEACVMLINETFKRQNKLLSDSIEYFNRLRSLGKYVEFWAAYEGDNIQGAAIFLWNEGHSCYYMHGGSSLHPHSGAMNYLQWKAMLTMKKRGVKCFDFVGARINPPKESKLEGIQRFKERFGSILDEGYLFKYVIDKYKYFLYRRLLFCAYFFKGKKYLGDMIDQEIKRGNI